MMALLLKWLTLERLLWTMYLLAWPPFLILTSRVSETPAVLGRWSVRIFIMLCVYAFLLLIGAIGVRRSQSRDSLSSRCLVAVVKKSQSDRRLWVLIAGLPVTLLLAGVIFAGLEGVVVTFPLAACLVNLVMVLVVWELLLLFAERPDRAKRKRVIQLMAATMATTLTIVALETTAAIIGIGAYLDWEINPKNLDQRMTCDEFDIRIATNDQGLREPRTIDPRRDVYRIVVVGDSMTFGWGVEYHETYAAVASSILHQRASGREVEIVNIGRPGANAVDYLRYIRSYARQLRADMVVIGFLVGNDCPVTSDMQVQDAEKARVVLARMIDQSRQQRGGPLRHSWLFRLADAGFYRKLSLFSPDTSGGKRGPIFGEPNPLAAERIDEQIARHPDSAMLRARRDRLAANGWIDKGLEWRLNPWLVRTALFDANGAAHALGVRHESRDVLRHEWTVCDGLLEEAKTVIVGFGGELVVLALPCAYQVSPDAVDFLRQLECEAPAEMLTTRVVNDWLVETCSRLGVTCVDPLETLRRHEAEGATLYYARDGHLTPEGHRILGQRLAESLEQRVK